MPHVKGSIDDSTYVTQDKIFLYVLIHVGSFKVLEIVADKDKKYLSPVQKLYLLYLKCRFFKGNNVRYGEY